ncbi:MAG TPA: AraC family transcriptional regulator, partial [Steroidobacteraceae bacterium]|nr:AraC family transcriptional regulator [Steroidobacteraceae bacterium]
APRQLRQLRDRIVDLAELDTQLSRNLAVAMDSFARGAERSLWQLFKTRCDAFPLDARVEAAVARICSSTGCVRINTLARTAGMSMRGFQIRFHAAVGLAPKEFARLERLRATLRNLDQRGASIADLALDRGFADQAHVTREMRRITGLTPARLRAQLESDRDGDAAIRMAAAFVRGAAV